MGVGGCAPRDGTLPSVWGLYSRAFMEVWLVSTLDFSACYGNIMNITLSLTFFDLTSCTLKHLCD
jgi:hypothetical protein